MTNLEDILELFLSGYGRRDMNNSRNALECVGEITPDKVVDDDEVNLVAVLGVHLPQRVSLSGPHDSDKMFNTTVNRIIANFLTLERGILHSKGAPKRVHRCIRTRQ